MMIRITVFFVFFWVSSLVCVFSSLSLPYSLVSCKWKKKRQGVCICIYPVTRGGGGERFEGKKRKKGTRKMSFMLCHNNQTISSLPDLKNNDFFNACLLALCLCSTSLGRVKGKMENCEMKNQDRTRTP